MAQDVRPVAENEFVSAWLDPHRVDDGVSHLDVVIRVCPQQAAQVHGVLLPEAQQQGLGKAILARLLSQAAAEGHRLIVLTAGPQAYSLYRKFGFEHIFEYTLYRLENSKQ